MSPLRRPNRFVAWLDKRRWGWRQWLLQLCIVAVCVVISTSPLLLSTH
ncbi:hypothetical protein ACFYZ9_33250 [Streptomyces sp. NPDC001691]